MALSRKLLRELNIPREAASTIMSAYRDTVNALIRERDEALASLANQTALEARIAQAEIARNDAVSARDDLQHQLDEAHAQESLRLRRAALTEALDMTGANPAVIPLLLDRLMPGDDEPIEAVNRLRELHPDLFAQPRIVGVDRISPPTEQSGPLTLEEIRRMNEDEIIKKWRQVSGALAADAR